MLRKRDNNTRMTTRSRVDAAMAISNARRDKMRKKGESWQKIMEEMNNGILVLCCIIRYKYMYMNYHQTLTRYYRARKYEAIKNLN